MVRELRGPRTLSWWSGANMSSWTVWRIGGLVWVWGQLWGKGWSMLWGCVKDCVGLGRDDWDSSGHRRPGLWEGRDFGFRGLGSGHVTCAARARGGAEELLSPITSVSTPSILKVSIVSAQAIVS
jgi:hypothetical protein